MMKKFAMALLMTALVASCSSRQDEMTDDMENHSGSTAHGTTSDDLAAGRGDTSLNNGAVAGGEQGSMNGTASMPMTDANILAKMSMTDSKEVAEGKLGSQKAKNAEVKKFAQMLVTHHTKMLNDGKATAQKLAITPAPMPNSPDSMAAVAAAQRLNTATAANFDSEFIAVQIEGHQKALSDLNSMMNATQNAEVKALIEKAIPVVQSHLDQARTIQTKLSGTAGTTGATTGTTTGGVTTTTTTPKGQ